MRLGPPDLEFEAISRDHPRPPRCPPVLSPLLRCPCSPGPEPVTPSSSTGSTSPSEPGSTTSAFRSGSSALAGPSTRVRSRTWRRRPGSGAAGHSRSGGGRAGPLARVPGSGAASRITVAGMPAPPTAPATSADQRHDPCQASSQGCPNERADYLFGPGTGGPVGDQHADHNRRLRVRVATATRPRTVIGIRADVQTRERPLRRGMRHSYSRQASPYSRPLPAGDSMIPTYLIAA